MSEGIGEIGEKGETSSDKEPEETYSEVEEEQESDIISEAKDDDVRENIDEESDDSKWSKIDWSDEPSSEREGSKWNEIDWSKGDKDEQENESKWNEIDWSKEKNDQSENKNKEYDENAEREGEYENIDSQSTVLIPKKSEIKGEDQIENKESEQEEDRIENEEEIIEIDPEEYENDHDPIIDTEEIEFIRDMEELGRMLREYEEKLGYSDEENENIAFNAEEAFRELKERRVNKDKMEENIEEIHSDDAQEENIDDISEVAEIEPEEFDYLWDKYEQYEQEGKNSEELRNLMHETEETYKMLKEAERLYEQQEEEKLRSVDHEDEENEEDVREEIDRIDAIEYFAEMEEKLYQQKKSQEEIDEQMEEIADNFFLSEVEEEQHIEQINDINKELRIKQAEINEESLERQECYDNDEELETSQEMESKELEEEVYTDVDDIEVDAMQPYQERSKKTMEKEKKSKSEETEEEEYERLQQLYRQETGKRPIYARKETKGFRHWLEQQELKTEELKEKEQQEEKWQKKLKKWIDRSSEEELSSELKVILKEILHNFQDYEDLEELYKKYKDRELTGKERDKIISIIKSLQNIDPIHLHLYLNISGFKVYFQEHNWWNSALISEIKYKFLRHLSKKYEIFKKDSKKISKFKQHHAKYIRKLVYNTLPIKSVGLINYKKKLNQRENAINMRHKKKSSEIVTVPPPNITHFKQKAINIRKDSNRNLLIRYLKKLDLKNIRIIYSFFLRYYNTSGRPANFGCNIKNEFKDWLKFNCFSSQIQKNLLLKACKNINENQEITSLIIEIIKTSKYSLNKIATLLKSIGLYISYVTIRKIALKKVYYDKYNLYKERFPAKNTRISNTKKEKIITELKKKNPPSLRKIAKKFSVSQRTVIRIALSLYEENIYLYHKKWTPTSNYITKAQKENIMIELEKKNPYTLQKIAQLSSVSPMSVYRMANDLYKDKRDIYRQKFNRHHLPKNKRDQIKKDIINSKLNIREIARKNNVSHSSVWFISLNLFKKNPNEHKKRFPFLKYLGIGHETHYCINFLLTNYFDTILNEKYYSEPRIFKNRNKSPDGIIMKNVFQKLLYRNDNKERLLTELNFDLEIMKDIKAVIFDYTNDVSEKNIIRKCDKYQNRNLILFIVGCRWHHKWENRIKNVPNDKKIKYFKRIFIVSYKLFADLLGLEGYFRIKFEEIIYLNFLKDIDSLTILNKELNCKLHNNSELIRDCKGIGVIKKNLNEFLN